MAGRFPNLRHRRGGQAVKPMVALGIIAVSLGLASCGREEGGVQAQLRPVREGTQGPGPRARALEKTPALQIGAVQGSPGHQLQDVRGAVRLPNGNLVLADRGTQDLRWFDPSGAHLRTVGRGGEGPGEFLGLISLHSRQDTVITFDERLQRVSFFSQEGEFVRSFQIPTKPGMIRGVFEDGSFLLAGILGEGMQASEGYRRMVRGTVHLGPEGEILHELPLFPDREEILSRQRFANGRSSMMVMPTVFGKETVFAVHGDGFAASDQTSREIRIYGQTGEVSGIIAWEGPDPTVTGAVIAQHQAYHMDRASGPEARRLTEQRFRDEIYPDSLPAHGQILFDPQGNLWVEDYQLPGQGPVLWRVFGGEGSQLDTVSMPGGFKALEIGDDYVLGLWWDELDVEYVRLYAVVDREG